MADGEKPSLNLTILDTRLDQESRRGSLPKRVGSLPAWARWLILLLVLAIVLAVVRLLLGHQPAFYVNRLSNLTLPERRQHSQAFLKTAFELMNDIQNARSWAHDFQEDQINAWLAEDFKRNHADKSLPAGVAEPRVALEGNSLRLGFRYRSRLVSTIVQIGLRAWVPERNLLVLELDGAWAGALPLPTNHTRKVIEQIAYANNFEVSWKRQGRKLVALLKLSRGQHEVVLQRVQIGAGSIRLEGASGRYLLPHTDYAPSAN